jgi:lysophospholipase L1-like esterase
VFYLHNKSVRNCKLREGVDLENELYAKVANELGLPFVDLDRQIPKEPRYFVDAVHFSPEGMDVVARLLAASIESAIGAGTVR